MNIFLLCIIISTVMLVILKRITALINGFALQSFFLFLLALYSAILHNNTELYVIAALVLVIKAVLIPYFLHWVTGKINMDENLGLLASPMISLIVSVLLSYAAYTFAARLIDVGEYAAIASFAISLSLILNGLFIMVFRMKALAQVIGLLVVENGLFLSAVSLCGDMPFFVEIAVFFDVLVFVIILGVFVFKISELFTHIDTDKLTKLRG